MLTRPQLLVGLGIIEGAIGKEYDEQLVDFDMWLKMFNEKGIELEHFLTACRRVAFETQIPALPPFGRIVALAVESAKGTYITADEAYGLVRKAMIQWGFYEAEKARAFLGPEIWSIIRGIGGWSSLCNSPITDRGTIFAQFRDAWKGRVERAIAMDRLPEADRPKLAGPSAAAEALALQFDAVKRLEHKKGDTER